jgi:hypothetical protein
MKELNARRSLSIAETTTRPKINPDEKLHQNEKQASCQLLTASCFSLYNQANSQRLTANNIFKTSHLPVANSQ